MHLYSDITAADRTTSFTALETAQAFWELLIPFGLKGGALSHIPSGQDDDEDDAMNGVEDGWNDKHTKLWLEYLTEKGGKGVSKDTWTMVTTSCCITKVRPYQ